MIDGLYPWDENNPTLAWVDIIDDTRQIRRGLVNPIEIEVRDALEECGLDSEELWSMIVRAMSENRGIRGFVIDVDVVKKSYSKEL